MEQYGEKTQKQKQQKASNDQCLDSNIAHSGEAFTDVTTLPTAGTGWSLRCFPIQAIPWFYDVLHCVDSRNECYSGWLNMYQKQTHDSNGHRLTN